MLKSVGVRKITPFTRPVNTRLETFAIPIFPDIRFFTIESLYLFVTFRKGKGSRVGLHRESRRALGYYYLHAHSRHVVTTDHWKVLTSNSFPITPKDLDSSSVDHLLQLARIFRCVKSNILCNNLQLRFQLTHAVHRVVPLR